METQKEYYYTYYSYEEWGRGYFGSRKCYCLPEEDVKYFGSSKDKSFKPTQKIILKDDYNTREEAYADEIILQQYYKVVENPHFANRSYQSSTKFYYILPTEKAIENGKKGGAKGGQKAYELGLGIYARTKEQMREDSKKGAQKAKELGVGFFAMSEEEQFQARSKVGKSGAGGRKTKELGVGVCGLTPEQRIDAGRKGGEIVVKLKLGIHGRSPEEKSEYGKKGGNRNKELGIGICGLSIEQRRKNVKKTNSQKWMCLETGYITTSGPLTAYQRAKGIDTSKRVRIS